MCERSRDCEFLFAATVEAPFYKQDLCPFPPSVDGWVWVMPRDLLFQTLSAIVLSMEQVATGHDQSQAKFLLDLLWACVPKNGQDFFLSGIGASVN